MLQSVTYICIDSALFKSCTVYLSAFRASQGEKADGIFDSQVVQYEPAHQGSVNTVTNLSPDLCVSGGSDQVHHSDISQPNEENYGASLFMRLLEKFGVCSQHGVCLSVCVGRGGV